MCVKLRLMDVIDGVERARSVEENKTKENQKEPPPTNEAASYQWKDPGQVR